MRVPHSLIPYAVGRHASRHAGSLVSAIQSQSSQTKKTSAALTSSNNILEEHVYEGELIGETGSSDAASGDTGYKTYTWQEYQSLFDDVQLVNRTAAIRAYINNSGVTGINRTTFENTLDVYV
jgi:hypothetical protein